MWKKMIFVNTLTNQTLFLKNSKPPYVFVILVYLLDEVVLYSFHLSF